MKNTLMRPSESELECIKASLSYDPETGEFRWMVRGLRDSKRIGALAGRRPGKASLYSTIKLNRKSYKAHRLAWYLHYGVWPTKMLDHINRNGHDNRIANLRLSTCSENNQNRSSKRTINPLKGAYRMKDGKWLSCIQRNKISKYLGTFNTPAEAHTAYVAAARELHGEFANHS